MWDGLGSVEGVEIVEVVGPTLLATKRGQPMIFRIDVVHGDGRNLVVETSAYPMTKKGVGPVI